MPGLKQLLPLEGRPLLQHVIDHSLASRLDEVILVLGNQAEEVQAALTLPTLEALRVVVNSHFAAGQSSSLRAGLRATSPRAGGAAILLGDQPGVTRETIDRVVERFAEGDALAVRPEYRAAEGCVPGHPVIIARAVWHELESLRGDEGARTLLRAHPEWLDALSLEGPPPPDVDTWSDYERLRGPSPTDDRER